MKNLKLFSVVALLTCVLPLAATVSKTINDVETSIAKGDITESGADAVINAANPQLQANNQSKHGYTRESYQRTINRLKAGWYTTALIGASLVSNGAYHAFTHGVGKAVVGNTLAGVGVLGVSAYLWFAALIFNSYRPADLR